MGSLDGRISRLEGLMPEILHDAREEERQRRQRAITRMILDEFAKLKASRAVHYRGGVPTEPEDIPGKILGPDYTAEDMMELVIRRVVEDQYTDLSPESRRYIADGWVETIQSWTRLDWMVSAGREGPPSTSPR